MRENKNRTLSRPGRLAALALAALFLPTLPALAQERDPDRRRQEIEELLQRNEDQMANLRDELRAAEREAQRLAEEGRQEAAEHAQRRSEELHELLDREATEARDLAAVLGDLVRDPRQDPQPSEPPPDAVLRSLRAAIGALRENDKVEDAEVLLALARSIQRGRGPAADPEREVEAERARINVNRTRQLDRLLVAFEEARRQGDEARANELHQHMARINADAEALARPAGRHASLDAERLAARESALAQRIDELRARQDEQVSRLAAKVEELSEAVRRLTQLAERR